MRRPLLPERVLHGALLLPGPRGRLVLERGHPHLEELVEVLGEDGDEAQICRPNSTRRCSSASRQSSAPTAPGGATRAASTPGSASPLPEVMGAEALWRNGAGVSDLCAVWIPNPRGWPPLRWKSSTCAPRPWHAACFSRCRHQKREEIRLISDRTSILGSKRPAGFIDALGCRCRRHRSSQGTSHTGVRNLRRCSAPSIRGVRCRKSNPFGEAEHARNRHRRHPQCASGRWRPE